MTSNGLDMDYYDFDDTSSGWHKPPKLVVLENGDLDNIRSAIIIPLGLQLHILPDLPPHILPGV